MALVILRLPAVIEYTGRSRSSIYLDISEGNFPAPISLGARSVGWIEHEVQAWIEERIKLSRPVQS
jgi:prophage regulatory protein